MEFSLKGQLSGHSSGIYCLANEGDLLYSGSGDGIFTSWDSKELKNLPSTINVGNPVFSFFINQSVVLIGQGKGGVHVIDRERKEEIRHLKYHSNGVFDIKHNPHHGHYYSLGGGGSLAVIDEEDYRLLIQIPISDKKLRRALVSDDGSRLFVSSSDGRIHCFETTYFNELFIVDAHKDGTYAMAQLDQYIVTGGRDAHLRVWKCLDNELQLQEEIPAHNFAIYDIAVINQSMFATASRDKLVKVWDLNNLKAPIRLLDGKHTHARSVNSVHFFNNTLATAGDDRLIKLWSLD